MVTDRLENADRQPNSTGHSDVSGVQLTARQEQILSLMRQGKVNKEIARELDISLGTVKQHLVAIFKKLKVSNRTMAVSCSESLLQKKETSSSDRIHARRPCIVLSLRFSGGPTEANRQFYDLLSSAAFDYKAHFINRDDGEGELVFGLKRSSEYDLSASLYIAGNVYRRLKQLAPSVVLRGALVAGFAAVSQNRFGGWSGDAVASQVIARAQQLVAQALENVLLLDESSRVIMQAYDINLSGAVPEQIALDQTWLLNHWNSESDKDLAGRSDEIECLKQFLSPFTDSRLALLDGESGMGKSRLCREIAREAEKSGYQLAFFKVTPMGIWDSVNCTLLAESKELSKQVLCDTSVKRLLIIDDIHLMSAEQRQYFVRVLQRVGLNQKLLLSGRQLVKSSLSEVKNACVLHLKRMDESQVSCLLRAYGVKPDLEQGIAEKSRGVPLFAIEMCRGGGSRISIALIITVASRLDRFNMDWKLLYSLADQLNAVSINVLNKMMQDSAESVKKSVERAVEIGVLETDGKNVRYRNSLVQEVVGYLFSGRLKLD